MKSTCKRGARKRNKTAKQFGSDYNVISKQFEAEHSAVRKFIYKQKTIKTVATSHPKGGHPSKSTSR